MSASPFDMATMWSMRSLLGMCLCDTNIPST